MREEATVPETTITCPSCGNQMYAGTASCPSCGAPLPEPGFVGKILGVVNGLFSTTQTHPKYWMIGGGSVAAVAVIAAVVMFGGFFGFSGRDICTATLTQAKDFGVISPSAELDSSSAKSTDVKNRRSCTAKAGDDIFTMLVDLKTEDANHKPCKDLKKQGSCVSLWSVARADGAATYQVREIPPEESDEALAADTPPPPQQQVPPPPGATPPADTSAFGDTDTAVDNSGAAPGPAAGGQPQ